MSENCSNNCSSCSQDCKDRKKESLLAPMNKDSNIKKVIGVVSGKGGVGKSLVTSLLAVKTQRAGYKTAILDADITGPSIPKAFGISGRAQGTKEGILPRKSNTGIEVMSLNLLTENETDPVIWRGPAIAGTVTQFWTDVIWNDVDYMYIDMPPGTGDVPLTVFQSIPVDAIVIVSSPQELVGMIVEKAVKMASMMNIPVLALVENMSYAVCPKCGEKLYVFGEGHTDKTAEKYNISSIAKIPMDNKIASACDKGEIEQFDGDWLDSILNEIIKL